MHRGLLRSALAGAASVIALTGAAAAQEAVGLEEVVVTAQRRSENLQDVPVAVSSFTAGALTRQGITDPTALARIVPGLNYDRASQAMVVFIRGVGLNTNVPGNEASVATFLDDVYLPPSATAFDFSSIERVEVARGPQGTLFGRNATGGVIQIFTKNPSRTPELNVSAGYGNYQTLSGGFYGSTPITDTLAVNLSASFSDQDKPWGYNPTRRVRQGYAKGYTVRGKLLWEPRDTTSALLTVARNYQKGDLGLGNSVVAGTVAYGNFNPDVTYPGRGFHDTFNDFETYWINKQDLISLKVQQELPFADLTSITAYQRLTPYVQSDVDASPTTRFNLAYADISYTTHTQELRLSSKAGSDLNWIIGGFYMYNRAVSEQAYAGSAFTVLGGSGRGLSYSTQVTKSYSVFGQADYELPTGTRFTAGLRYTSDRQQLYSYADWYPLAGGISRQGPFDTGRTFNKLTYRVGVDQKVRDGLMVYAAYSRGFKSGVYNMSAVAPSPFPGSAALPRPVEPEVLDAATAGFKSEFLDRRLRLNVEGYHYDYKNLQVSTLSAGSTILVNGGKAKVKGFEAEMVAMPSSNLTLTGSAAYMHARYVRFPNAPTFFPVGPGVTPTGIPRGCTLTTYPVQVGVGPAVQAACSAAGNKVIHAPAWTFSLAADYVIPLEKGSIALNGSFNHTGSYYFEPDNNPFSRQKAHDTFNGSATWSPDDRYSVRAWVKNLTNEKIYSFIGASTVAGFKYAPAAPRTFGVTVEYKM